MLVTLFFVHVFDGLYADFRYFVSNAYMLFLLLRDDDDDKEFDFRILIIFGDLSLSLSPSVPVGDSIAIKMAIHVNREKIP